MLSSHPHIEALRRYTRNASTLPAAEILALERHLASCAFCTDIVREFQKFMEIRETVNTERVAEESRKLLEKIRTGREPIAQPVLMYPRKRENRAETVREKRPVLAAAGGETTTQEFSAVATLFSADERVMLRILLDHVSNEYAIYVLTEKHDDAGFLLLESPLSDIPLMTDDSGMCRIPVQRELLIESDVFRLHSPRERFSLTGEQAAAFSAQETLRLTLQTRTVSMHMTGEELLLEFSSHDAEEVPTAFAGVAQEDSRHTAPCVHNTARLPFLPPFEETLILLY